MKHTLVMPDDDTRSARVVWSEQKGDVMELCIAVDHDAPSWQSMETAPKDGTNILLVNYKGNMATGMWNGSGEYAGWWIRGSSEPNIFFNSHHGPSHWMPLPKSPSNSG
jgi:hypothetical protein